MMWPFKRLDTAAPWVSAALCAAILLVGSRSGPPEHDIAHYHRQVKEAIQSIPLRINGWIGFESEPLPAAVEILRPTIILQRTYLLPEERRSVALLLSHCADVRDMVGHYPPICYPANGFTLVATGTSPVLLWGEEVLAATYQFTTGTEIDRREMSVLNLFVLPCDGNGSCTANEMGSVERASRSPIRAGLGCAQVQLIVNGRVEPSEWTLVAEPFMAAVEDAMRIVAEGVHGG